MRIFELEIELNLTPEEGNRKFLPTDSFLKHKVTITVNCNSHLERASHTKIAMKHHVGKYEKKENPRKIPSKTIEERK